MLADVRRGWCRPFACAARRVVRSTTAAGPAVTNPFTLVHCQIWAALTGFADWAALVKPVNRIRFDAGADDPLKFERAADDRPEVALLDAKFDWDLFHFDASAAEFVHEFHLVCSWADLDILPVDELRWQTSRALCKVGPHLGLPGLVREFRLRGGLLSGSAQTPGKDLARWAALLNVTVLFDLTRSQVLAGTFPADVVPYG